MSPTLVLAARGPRTPEKVIQAQGVSLLRSLGAKVYVIGTRRRKGDYQGTMMAAGLPDVLAFLPIADSPTPARLQLWWEAKAEGGRLSDAQIEFRACCEAAAVPHVCGDLDRLIAWLVLAKYLKADNVAHYRRPTDACTDACFLEIAHHGGVSARCATHGRTHKEAVQSGGRS